MKKSVLHPRTAVVNKMQKNQSKQSRQLALRWLKEKFPQVFDTQQRIRPLKIGIMEDILLYADEAAAQGISKSKLRQALALFARSTEYLCCIRVDENRVTLQGETVGIVTEEEAEKAALKRKKRVEKSVRNVRKSPSVKSNDYRTAKSNTNLVQEPFHYPQGRIKESAPIPSREVVIKHKASRAYDPEMVARLKAKLGLKIQDS